MKKIDFKKLVVSFSIVAILVLISMIFTKGTMDFYKEIIKPEMREYLKKNNFKNIDFIYNNSYNTIPLYG